jgi:hypothetical protein
MLLTQQQIQTGTTLLHSLWEWLQVFNPSLDNNGLQSFQQMNLAQMAKQVLA